MLEKKGQVRKEVETRGNWQSVREAGSHGLEARVTGKPNAKSNIAVQERKRCRVRTV